MLKYVEICLYSGPVLSYDILSEDCASSTSPLQVLYAYYIYIYTYYYLCINKYLFYCFYLSIKGREYVGVTPPPQQVFCGF